MYKSTKKEDGTYSRFAFLKRGYELVSLPYFLSKLNKYIPNCGIIYKIRLCVDFYWCLIRYGAVANDYFEYRFWEKTHILRKEYITMKMNIRIKRMFNREKSGIFRDKMMFNLLFAEYRNLNTFSFDGSTIEDFWQFVQSTGGKIIAKPLTGYSGLGIHKPDVSTREKAESVYKQLKDTNDFFLEEVFPQDGILNEVCPSSLNTVRIYTLHDGEKVHLMQTLIRFGGGNSVVDNIHSGGMICVIDKETGIIISQGYNLSGDVYCKHPFSKIVLPGIKIPNWDLVLKYVEEAASKYPQQGYVAWDIAVSENKVSIIEGNDGGNFDAIQVPMQRGVKREYEQIIELKCKNTKGS